MQQIDGNARHASRPIQEGDEAPAFTVPSDSGRELGPADFAGKPLVIYFYPKDDTPGCTAQACAFRDMMPEWQRLGVAIIGISKDDIGRHEKFRDKFTLNFPLLADTDGRVCEAYGTWVEKSMYGRKYMGIDRATFLVDGAGVIRRIWRNVKVPGHIDAVREAVEAL